MNAAAGESALLLAFGAAVLGCVSLVVGLIKGRPSLVRAGRTYTWVILIGAVAATAAMQHALITHDFSLQYVADNDSVSTPILFRITAMWSNLAGSILLWGLVLAGYLAAVAIRFRRRYSDPLVGWATAIGYGVAAFFFGLMLTASNPFIRVHGAIPTDGPGPDPLLQNHILVAFHPPILYLGLVGFTVPFAFACASLITGRVGEGWLVETRRWTLFSWGFLTVGVILGAWWSYEVLGWGGYWAWDPVENAAFLPWITGTAFLHSVMVQERRGMLRVWNLSLLVATFSLTVLATFLTRSGVLNSVHSFNNTGVGPALLTFFAVIVAMSVGLLAWRGDLLRSPGSINSPVSRESAFLLNNLLFGAFALIVLLGTVFPLIAQAVNGSQITVGAPYFDRMTMPVVVCILFLMAVAPILPWRRTTPGLLRTRLYWPAAVAVATLVACVIGGVRGLDPLLAFGLGAFAGTSALRQLFLEIRRRGLVGFTGSTGGGMVVHVGVVLIAVAFAASHAFAASVQLPVKQGQTVRFDGHSFTFLGTRNVAFSTHTSLQAQVRVDHGQAYAPAISYYPFATEAIGTPSVRSTLSEDIYLTLASPPAKAGQSAVIGVIVEPLVSWIWIGGGVMLVGTLLAAWPGRRRRAAGDRAEAGDGAEAGTGAAAGAQPVSSRSASEAAADSEAPAGPDPAEPVGAGPAGLHGPGSGS
ncbi:MAG TPA: heme lyase CcmF/NrfE family subunit [Acidimicrobiales bacterium]|nr:heme lyase CcmF/NrfE family subunit [Acidimicrobiales bacterium]